MRISSLFFTIFFVLGFPLTGWSECPKGHCYNGYGSYLYDSGNKYVGQFKDGKRNGQGTFTPADGDEYVGQYKDDKKNGRGTYTWASGDKYVGQFRDDTLNGQGTFTWTSGNKYVGQFKDGERNGQGTFTWANGNQYVGQYRDGLIWEGTVLRRDKIVRYREGEIDRETILTPDKKKEIVSEQLIAAHSLLSSLGYGVGNVSSVPNSLFNAALSAYCQTLEPYQDDCPNLAKIDLRADGLLSAMQTSRLEKQTQLKSAKIIGTGSAIRINATGSLVTNSHVINDCLAISDPDENYFKIVINNQVQDIAILDVSEKVGESNKDNYALLSDDDIVLGQSIFVAGFPFTAMLKSLNFTEGTISSLSGIGGNTQHFQITAAMQPGNSGGPILSETGSVIGVAVGKLSDSVMLKLAGSLPQSVNFGIDVQILKRILDNNSIPYETGSPFFSFLSSREKVAAHAQEITEQINCWGQN